MNGNVYFARCGDLVKIGYTGDVAARLSQLQTGNPHAVEIVAVITNVPPSMERVLHRYFADARARGEWFNQSIPLRQLITHIRGGARPTTVRAVEFYAQTFPNEKMHANPHVDVRLTAKHLMTLGYAWEAVRALLEHRGPEYPAACDSYARVLTRNEKSS